MSVATLTVTKAESLACLSHNDDVVATSCNVDDLVTFIYREDFCAVDKVLGRCLTLDLFVDVVPQILTLAEHLARSGKNDAA